MNTVLVVGGGLAGLSTARRLRELGFEGSVTIVDPAPLPYDRPPLSKTFLLGETTEEGLLLASAEWYAENKVEVLKDSVVALRPDVELVSGETIRADRVVLATGSRARRLPISGADLPGVRSLRTVADARRLREDLQPDRELVIVGAGLIGAEVASTAHRLGLRVTLVDPVETPLVPAVGRDLATYLHDMHRKAGIRVITGQAGEIRRDGSRYAVVLADGTALQADTVLSAVGGVPDIGLASAAGLATCDGIVVDANGRTSNPAVYAVGDSARVRLADGTLTRRGEHWEAARQSGERAAAAILGAQVEPQVSSWFWSDRHGVHVEAFGRLRGLGTTVLRGRPGGPWAALHINAAGYLVGAAAIDDSTTVRAARRIAERRRQVDPAELADPTTNLRKLAR
ncbi:NADPH-dependent 2,4-dienoyl-CoA reductase/sulfur reductase-like enzyme [Kibdelosporangium banguiense]|uniref:NADPH-dependent 2,4-dienoyl-CoA reductase/sulfur reductase-like enzyme n=1 Tax=Kibdelosporangium banguiense TaxID=1365924 RepID=A0ABS4TXU4_9PSEU|nr:FAD-dependent oxidoreductase [Kibdelosporangium banguiense]MBP2329221.1 NADPH-dependent 2,4-dienoyl-CoA reductase/sulfur reductase-like enzyme [Kibdelosporangium banguiense]